MPVFQDHFLDNRHGWTEWETGVLICQIEGSEGRLRLTNKAAEGHYTSEIEVASLPERHGFHCVMETTRGPETNGSGLSYHRQGRATFFSFLVSPGGYYQLARSIDGESHTLVPWTKSEHIRIGHGEMNELLAQVEPGRQLLWINGQLVHQIDVESDPCPAFGPTVCQQTELLIHSVAVLDTVPLIDAIDAGDGPESARDYAEVVADLEALIGIREIKHEVKTLSNVLRVQQRRSELGLNAATTGNHIVLSGPPGTGKTTVARMLGEIFRQLGVLSKGHVVETDRSGLVGEYVGKTAPKVDEIVAAARGGILFIDEAYALRRPGTSGADYGQEAIDTLLKRMEDLRDDLVVIIAGYDDEMQHFLNSNPGMKSRFNRFFQFEHYRPAELLAIFEQIVDKAEYVLTDDARARASDHLRDAYAHRDRSFGNGRYVRSLVEKSIERHANRLMSSPGLEDIDVVTFEQDDVPIDLLGSVERRPLAGARTTYL